MTLKLATQLDYDDISIYDHHIDKQHLKKAIDQNYVFAIMKENKVIGVLRYNLWYQTIPCVELIYIDFSYHHQGIGKKAMTEFEQLMKTQGFHEVMTTTQADEFAYLFYEKLNYKKIGSFLPPRQEALEWIYLKHL
jgi:GNAT superfamily N-acetyltransferase